MVAYDDDELPTEAVQKHSPTMWIVIAVLAFAVLIFFLIFILRILWRRVQHQKIRKDAPAKPLSLHRRPTPAVKSPATGNAGSNTHYLKKSPSPTGLSPSSGGNSPTSIGSNAQSRSPKDSPTSEETSGPSMVDDASFKTECEVPINESRAFRSTAQVTTSREILTGSLGQLFFSLKWCKKDNKPSFVVHIKKCQNLPGKDSTHSSIDPYVKLQLLPEKAHKVKTRVLKNTRNPVYEEDFTFFNLNPNQLQSFTLHFIVLTFDRYSRDEIIGEVFFPLNSIDIMNQEGIMYQKDIQPRLVKVKNQGRGEILVSLCWQPAANRLTIVILKARNLPKMDVTGLADPYVKIYLIYKGQRIAKKKTHVKKRTLNPVFNESFVFDIPNGSDELDNVSLEILLLDWDRVTRNEVIGRLDMGAKAVGESSQHHWSEVCKAPRRQIADWHKLYE